MASPQAVDFRQTLAFVTSAAGTYVETDSGGTLPLNPYPFVTPQGNTVGWVTGNFPGGWRDRNAAVNPQQSGTVFIAPPGIMTWKLDVPPGSLVTLRGSFGDDSTNFPMYGEWFDNTTSLGLLYTGTPAAAARYYDATGVERTSSTDWQTNNASRSATCSSGALIFKFGDGGTNWGFVTALVASWTAGGGGGGKPTTYYAQLVRR